MRHAPCTNLYSQTDAAATPSITQLGRAKGYTQRWETLFHMSHSLFDFSLVDQYSYAIK